MEHASLLLTMRWWRKIIPSHNAVLIQSTDRHSKSLVQTFYVFPNQGNNCHGNCWAEYFGFNRLRWEKTKIKMKRRILIWDIFVFFRSEVSDYTDSVIKLGHTTVKIWTVSINALAYYSVIAIKKKRFGWVIWHNFTWGKVRSDVRLKKHNVVSFG